MRVFSNSSEICRARMRAGLSIQNLSARSNLSLTTCFLIEKGNRPVHPGTAAKLCEALGVSFDDVFTIVEGQPAE